MSLRFPASRIASMAEFEAWLRAERTLFDQRWLYEQQQIKSGQSNKREGTCALCLMPTIFHSGAPESERNWREEMLCDCPRRLSNRQRAILHYLRSRAGVARGQRLAAIGPIAPIEGMLQEWGVALTRLPRLVGGRLRCADGAADHVLCADYLQLVPPIRLLLRELARVLRPGGELALTVPFDVSAAETKSRAFALPPHAADNPEPLHLFGWDLLDLLRDLGFHDVAANFYWSDEFGYLGPFNMVIGGVKG